MSTSVAVLIAALVLASLVSSCATRWPSAPTAPECVFIDRCRNAPLSSSDGSTRAAVWLSTMVALGK
jgi:hypothetical protein